MVPLAMSVSRSPTRALSMAATLLFRSQSTPATIQLRHCLNRGRLALAAPAPTPTVRLPVVLNVECHGQATMAAGLMVRWPSAAAGQPGPRGSWRGRAASGGCPSCSPSFSRCRAPRPLGRRTTAGQFPALHHGAAPERAGRERRQGPWWDAARHCARSQRLASASCSCSPGSRPPRNGARAPRAGQGSACARGLSADAWTGCAGNRRAWAGGSFDHRAPADEDAQRPRLITATSLGSMAISRLSEDRA